MVALSSRFPPRKMLVAGLSSILSGNGQVSVLRRRPNVRESTFPTEIVTCQLSGGSKVRLFCKYGDTSGASAYGHRGGVGYEASVYRHALQPLKMSTPTFYGECTDRKTGTTWLILSYLEKGVRVSLTTHLAGMKLAASWIARFHTVNTQRLRDGQLRGLIRYDAEYYLGWARRTSCFAGHLHRRFPWLAPVCAGFDKCVTLLLASSPTLVHGEYYPGNIVVCGRTVYPVDWESAAIAAAEIDLASLTEGWRSPKLTMEWEKEYQRIRWSTGPPARYESTLAAARLYLHFRWLGERPERTIQKKHWWRFQEIRSLGTQLGLI